MLDAQPSGPVYHWILGMMVGMGCVTALVFIEILCALFRKPTPKPEGLQWIPRTSNKKQIN
jgi:hypothetical protein